MSGLVIGIGVVLLALAIVGGAVVLSHRYEQARTEQSRALAQELGLEFHELGDADVLAAIGHFKLFNRGRGRKLRNMLIGETDESFFAVFDYQYTTGGGKNQHTYRQTVISFRSAHLALPDFELLPENMFHRLGQAFGAQDIDFVTHPQFSKRYVLRGPNQTAIRELFGPERLDTFASLKAVNIEAERDRLIYYRTAQRVKPEDMRGFLEEGFRIYRMFKQV